MTFSWIRLALFFAVVTDVRCVRDVRLEIVPEFALHGGEATLRCYYVLDDTVLYTLKWSRGLHEFYRFVPRGRSTVKVFPLPGLEVDRAKSNESQVTIRNLDYRISGNFTCEATTEAPYFVAEADTKTLIIAILPEGSPVIMSERDRYNPGDTLKANCTALPSSPPAVLSFTLNNQPVGQPRTILKPAGQRKFNRLVNEALVVPSGINLHQQTSQQQQQQQQQQTYGDLQWNELSMTLQPFHYVNGQLNLRCIVQIEDIYNATSELQLGAGLREPVPERVTSENAANNVSSLFGLTILSLGLGHALLR